MSCTNLFETCMTYLTNLRKKDKCMWMNSQAVYSITFDLCVCETPFMLHGFLKMLVKTGPMGFFPCFLKFVNMII